MAKQKEEKLKNLEKSHGGFTLIELLVAMAILAVMLLLLSQLLDSVQKAWNFSEGRVSQFREARVAFDIIAKNLSQATLNTYWDYQYNKENNVERYKRQSELHFVTFGNGELGNSRDGEVLGHSIFFQAPLGFSNKYRNLNNLMVARGYYLLFGSDSRFKPSPVRAEPRYRFRIMEYRPPAEDNQIYIDGDEERLRGQEPDYRKWYRDQLEKFSTPLAENIIAFVVSPRDTVEEISENKVDTYSRIASNYRFDSNTHLDPRFVQQIPPLVRITMIAIDEPSALRLEDVNGRSVPKLVKQSMFFNTRSFDDDLEDVKSELIRLNVNYRVFSTIVAIRSSRWSTAVPES